MNRKPRLISPAQATARWRERHPDRELLRRQKQKARRKNDPVVKAKAAETKRQWTKKHPKYYANHALKKLYGITIVEFEAVCAAQGGCCAMCGENKKLTVDHDHVTGQFRAAVCQRCNTAIAWAERIDLLEKARIYLQRYREGNADLLAIKARQIRTSQILLEPIIQVSGPSARKARK